MVRSLAAKPSPDLSQRRGGSIKSRVKPKENFTDDSIKTVRASRSLRTRTSALCTSRRSVYRHAGRVRTANSLTSQEPYAASERTMLCAAEG